jgi:hypothetical protein
LLGFAAIERSGHEVSVLQQIVDMDRWSYRCLAVAFMVTTDKMIEEWRPSPAVIQTAPM